MRGLARPASSSRLPGKTAHFQKWPGKLLSGIVPVTVSVQWVSVLPPKLNGICSAVGVRTLLSVLSAAKVEDYTPDEIGVGGPYDLCAAGRYWCWDAMFLASQENGARVLQQLLQVCAQAQTDRYQMGERYDMNYVYYNTGANAARSWHGAKQYYEYPNVWIYVFVCLYLDVRRGFDCDLELSPLFRNGSVTLAQYGVAFTVTEGKVTEIRNLGDRPLTVLLPRENRTVTV